MDKKHHHNHGKMDLTAKETHGTRKFVKGIALGTLVGSGVILAAYGIANKEAVSEKLADTGEILKRTGDRAHRIGDTARYTLRSMRGDLSKGAKSIKKDIDKGTDDIRKTMGS